MRLVMHAAPRSRDFDRRTLSARVLCGQERHCRTASRLQKIATPAYRFIIICHVVSFERSKGFFAKYPWTRTSSCPVHLSYYIASQRIYITATVFEVEFDEANQPGARPSFSQELHDRS